MTHDRIGPTTEQMRVMAEQALADLPGQFRDGLEGVILRIEDFATAEQLASVDLSDAWDLSGLYEGRALTEQSVWESGTLPPMIWLFRQPLIAEWRETGVRMDDLVRHVIVHEAGHHFGFSDDDMHAIEDSA